MEVEYKDREDVCSCGEIMNWGESEFDCPNCNGYGKIEVDVDCYMTCLKCKGKGSIEESGYYCSECR